MVSLKKMKMKAASPFKRRGSKRDKVEMGKKEEPVEAVETVKVNEEANVETTPVDIDPIMEDREDAEETNANPSRSVEEERNEVDDDERSPPDDDEVDPEPEPEAPPEPAAMKMDDESVMTEANAPVDETLSTVKEEPSKEEEEETEEKVAEEPAPADEKQQGDSGSMTQTLELDDDEDITMDATATTMQETGCVTPVHAPAFCGCSGFWK